MRVNTVFIAQTSAFSGHPARKQMGFTLVEVMVAVIIFGFIGIAAHRMVNSAISAQQIQEERAERIAEIQRAMLIISRDFLQVARRPIRDEYGDPFPLLKMESDVEGTDSRIEFTRHGWRNPLGLPRSSLQHLMYEYDDEQLIRRYWLVLDRMSDSKSYKQILLTKLDGVVFEVIPSLISGSSDPDWQRDWPDGDDQRNLMSFPAAVKITLKTQDMGDIARIFSISSASPASNDRGRGQGQGREQGRQQDENGRARF